MDALDINPGDLLVTTMPLTLREAMAAEGADEQFIDDAHLPELTPVIAIMGEGPRRKAWSEGDVVVWTPLGPGRIIPSLLTRRDAMEG